MCTEIPYFCSRVRQDKNIPFNFGIPSNMVAIRVMLMKQLGSRRIDAPEHRITWHDTTVVTDRNFEVFPSDFLLPSSRDRYTEMLVEFLSNVMGVPQVEQPTIIDRIFLGVELADIPGVPVTCLIVDAIVFLMGDEQTIRDRVARESLRRNRPILIPATESSIQGLEKVRLDMLEATIRQTPCVVCKEGLDHFDDGHGVEEGIDRDQVMITRLPCSHLFHGDCIVPWLGKSHLCPLCRYPMPTMKEEEEEEEEDEPSKPSGPQRLSWPMLLTVSANAIAAVLLCRVLKQS